MIETKYPSSRSNSKDAALFYNRPLSELFCLPNGLLLIHLMYPTDKPAFGGLQRTLQSKNRFCNGVIYF